MQGHRLDLFILIATISNAVHSYGEALPTLEDIENAHRSRTEASNSLQISWEGTRVIMNGNRFDQFPLEPTVLSIGGSLIVQGGMSRVDKNMDMWNGSTRVIRKDSTITDVFKDGIGKNYVPSILRGTIRAENRLESSFTTNMMTMFDQPSPRYLDGEKYQVLRRQESSAGSLIVVGDVDYEQRNPGGMDHRREYYLDEDNGYVLTKYRVMTRDGRVRSEARITYAQDPTYGPVPEKLEIDIFGFRWDDVGDEFEDDFVPKDQYRFKITNVVFNEGIDPGVFEFDFPIGTKVYDSLLDVEYTVGESFGDDRPQSWIDDVINDSEQESDSADLTSGEALQADTDSQLAGVDPAEPSDTGKGAGRVLMIGLGLAIGVMALLFLVKKRR